MELDVRVVPSNGVHENKLIVLMVEVARFRPSEVIHLVNKCALPDHCSNEIDRKDTIISVSKKNTLCP